MRKESKRSLCGVPDPGLVFQASLTSAQVMVPDSQASLISLLLEGHSLLALASIMFAPGGINQVRAPLSTTQPAPLTSSNVTFLLIHRV